MGKLIIDNRSKILSDQEVCLLVIDVIKTGRISNNNKQYCRLTEFDDRLTEKTYTVYTDINKKSDRFIICDRN